MGRGRKGLRDRAFIHVGAALALLSWLGVLATDANPVAAQSTPRLGVWAGVTQASQEWNPGPSTESLLWPTVGVFGEATTALGWLEVGGGVRYRRTGAEVPLAELDEAPEAAELARLWAHVLNFPVRAKLVTEIGPLTAFAAFGVFLDVALHHEIDPRLRGALDESASRVFGVSVAAGVESSSSAMRYGIEAAFARGLSASFEGPFRDVDGRALEVMVRISRPAG